MAYTHINRQNEIEGKEGKKRKYCGDHEEGGTEIGMGRNKKEQKIARILYIEI